MKKTVLTTLLLAFVCMALSPQQALSQDGGNLLIALDTAERSLKKLIAKEEKSRKAKDASFVSSLEKLRKEITALRDQIGVTGDMTPGAAAADKTAVVALEKQLASIKAELVSLRQNVQDNSRKMTAVSVSPTASLASANVAGKAAPAPKKAPKRAKYHNLRFQDNYNYLNNPANRGGDFFDALKRIPVGNSAHVSIGGQYRMRYESDSNRKLGASDPQSEGLLLNRLYMFGDFKVKKAFRLFAEFKYAAISGNDLPASILTEDKPDIENLFADFWLQNDADGQFGVRVGRQELQFGKQRLISPLNWANNRRTFEGLRVMNNFGAWKIDAFVTKPVNLDRDELNKADNAKLFSGAYVSGKVNGNLLSFYFLASTKDEPVSLLTGLTGDNEYLTLGLGYDGKANQFDWSTEVAYQGGTLGSNDIRAYMLTLSGGYTLKNSSVKPRIGFVYDIASGDSDPTDTEESTFNQLFPLGHAYLGWADQVGRRNIKSFSIQLSAKPSKFIVTKLNWFNFDLNKSTDAFYNAGGKAVRSDPTGAAGKDVGKEVDALVIFKPNPHASVHIGYAHFSPGKFIENTGSAESHNLFYVMVPVTF